MSEPESPCADTKKTSGEVWTCTARGDHNSCRTMGQALNPVMAQPRSGIQRRTTSAWI